MLRAWLLWLLAAACCAPAFAFTHAGAALAALCVPVLADSVGVLVPVGAIIAIVAARILYKKGLV